MKIKANELTRPALDWAVAKCVGAAWALWRFKEAYADGEMHYSTDWSEGGPIIEQERITLLPCDSDWEAQSSTTPLIAVEGPTPLIAAMRCYVASKLGDEVDIPEELQ